MLRFIDCDARLIVPALVLLVWIPMLGGVINGVGHFWGYRNFECPDAARNVVPWGILIGGEELHNNHHTYANSAKLSVGTIGQRSGVVCSATGSWPGLKRTVCALCSYFPSLKRS